jgi:hypothetical protein
LKDYCKERNLQKHIKRRVEPKKHKRMTRRRQGLS